MLRRSQRLSTKQFDEVIRSGKAVHSAFFLVRTLPAPDKAVRIAAVTPVKVAKKAVIRNHTRRRIYEAVRPICEAVKEPVLAIIIAKSSALTASLDSLAADLRALFVKAGLLR